MTRYALLAVSLLATAAGAQEAQTPLPPAPDFALRPAATLERFEDPAVRTAVKEAAAELARQPVTNTGPVLSGTARRKTDEAFEAAAIGDCLHGDALKHTPPVVRIGPIPIGLGGFLALPFWGYAAATGKCR